MPAAARPLPSSPLAGVVRRRPELVVVVAALLLRLLWVGLVARNVPLRVHGDQYSYWYYGRQLAAGGGYVSWASGLPTAYYPVGFPLILAGLFRLTDALGLPGGDGVIVGCFHAVLGALAVWLLYVIGTAVWSRRVGLLAAGLLALFPSAVFAAATFSIETTFVALALGALALIVTHDWSTPMGWQRLAVLCVVLAAAVMVRPFALPFLVIIAIAAWRGRGWRSAVRHVGAAVVVLAVAITPWVLRNERQFDTFIPFSTNLGDTMCMSRFPGSDAGFHWATHEWCADPDLPEHVRSGENVAKALEFIREHPGEEARLVVVRLVEMMRHDHETLTEALSVNPQQLSGGAVDVLSTLADWWFYVVGLAAVAGIGVTLRLRWRDRATQSVLLAAASLLVFPLGLWGAVRFHAPLVPFVALFAAVAAVELADARRRDQSLSSSPRSSSDSAARAGSKSGT